MNYNTFVAMINKKSKVKLYDAMTILEDLYDQANNSDEAIDEYCKIYDLVDIMLQQNIYEGDDSDFHNIAVVCAQQEDYEIACQILDKGLEIYKYNVDLLADYLNYGMQCGREEQCRIAYKRLNEIRERWNWRAYLFLIDYLNYLSSGEVANNDAEIEELIKEFQKKYPEMEDAYLVEAEYLFRKNKVISKYESEKSFVSVLEYVTSEKSPVKRTPKCDLKLADYYFDNRMYLDRAIELLQRCKKNSLKVQQAVNRKYVFLLLALSYMSKFYEVKNSGNNEEEELQKIILNVYDNYHKAAVGAYNSRVNGCKHLIEVFVMESGIAYPYDDNVVNYL